MSKRTERRESASNWHRSCTSKKRYHDREDAKCARHSYLRQRPDKPLRIYECGNCNGFHLASSWVQSRKVQS